MRTCPQGKYLLTLFVAAIFTGSPAFADKPGWAGGGKPGNNAQESRKGDSRAGGGRRDDRRDDRRGDSRHDDRDDTRVGAYFNDHHRAAMREYYDERFRSGHCPPGLAKKHNGCLPPGQAKKWHKGHPLPRDVIFYDLPPSVVVRLGPPPTGHRYVRVATDILLIAIGTGMVVDAIDDLSGM